jgi:adenylate cyclase
VSEENVDIPQAVPSSKVPAESPPAAPEAEHKQITVLFADVVGSLELAEQVGAEEWRRIMERLLAILREGVQRFEGTVDKFTGDGVMALFGAPIAHENHAQRACYAALRLQDELASYAAELRRTEGLSLSVRMGIHSGRVVAGALGDDLAVGYTAIGHTVGLAERIESLAEPGKVYLTEDTASLVEGDLAVRELGGFRVKGASRPLQVYELAGIGSAGGRLGVASARGFSRLVGRVEEMELLERALERGLAGEARVIGIVGEAGVGKSRLCHELAQRARARGIPIYHVAGQPHAKSVPLVPMLALMRAYFDITEVDSGQTARERIAGKLLLLDERFAGDLPLVFGFLGVPDPERPPPRMDPEARERHLMSVIGRLIRAQSAREPGLSLLEDMHWLDPASERFFVNSLEARQGVPGLVVVNFRPEYRAPWMSKSYYRQIGLAPLSAEAIDQLLGDLLGSDQSLEDLPELIRARTGGNPFFLEEVVQALLEAGNLGGERGAYRLARPVQAGAVPASVEAVLAARIDRLAPREKLVLHAAAVIGKEFAEAVLARVLELEHGELEAALRGLVDGEFVYEQELYPDAVYAFKHPLTQEVAYESQLVERRAPVHAAVARAIAAQYPDRLEELGALLALHWEAAGEQLAAARCHAQAAAWSGTSDPTESLAHWRRVRVLTDELDESEETVALGITARIFSLQYGYRLGISHEEARQIFSEAERMATTAGDNHSRAFIQISYGAIKVMGDGEFRDSLRLGRQAVALAEESGDPALYMIAAGSLAYWVFSAGSFREAAELHGRALELAGGDLTIAADTYVGCPYAYALMFRGAYLLWLGELEQGRELIERGIKLAREQGDLEVVGWGHLCRTAFAWLSGETDTAVADARQALEIAERIGDSFSRASAWANLGVAQQLAGEWQPAIEAIERSQTISRERRTAAEIEAWRLIRLGESHLALGDPERAGACIEAGLGLARERGQAAYEGLAGISLARVLLAPGGTAAKGDVEATLARALELAHQTEAKSFVPMIHVELAQLALRTRDAERRVKELREAHRLYTEVGASGHAKRIADELATPAT